MNNRPMLGWDGEQWSRDLVSVALVCMASYENDGDVGKLEVDGTALRCSNCALVVTADPSLSPPSFGPSPSFVRNKSERVLFSPREDNLRAGCSPGAIVPSHALTSGSSSSLSLSAGFSNVPPYSKRQSII